MNKNRVKGEPLSVLLVEDNLDHAELVRRSFEDHRVANSFHHVADGEAAMDYLLGRGDYADAADDHRPHLILLDLRLPKMDGLEVLSEIRNNEKLQALLVVILTTSTAERDVAAAYKHHANSYLVKPVDFDKFTQLMEDLGFYWLGWNVYPWPDSQAVTPT